LENAVILKHLEDFAFSLGIGVRYEIFDGEAPFFPGGLCRIGNESVLIINTRASTEDKISVLARSLKRFDLSQVYLKPAIRDLIENAC
jgi:hypothetical protein